MFKITGSIYPILVSPAWQADSLLLKSLGKPKISHSGSSETHSVVSNSCNPMDYSLQGSSVHDILQGRILKWVAISCSGDRPNPGIESVSPASSALADRFFTTSITWEALLLYNVLQIFTYFLCIVIL